MSNVVMFKTHSSFTGKMETTLEGFLKRVNLWLTQRNSIDAEHSGSRYFDHRLNNLMHFAVLAKADKVGINITGQRHNFDEEGNSYSYCDFMFTIPDEGAFQTHLNTLDPVDADMMSRCKHYFYQLKVGERQLDWDGELRELMEESIPNADVESIIGNLLMLAQIPGMNLVELIDVVRRKITTHRIKMLVTEVEKGGVFYVYDTPTGPVLSITATDHEKDGVFTPLKPALVDAVEFIHTSWSREVAKHHNRTTYALRY